VINGTKNLAWFLRKELNSQFHKRKRTIFFIDMAPMAGRLAQIISPKRPISQSLGPSRSNPWSASQRGPSRSWFILRRGCGAPPLPSSPRSSQGFLAVCIHWLPANSRGWPSKRPHPIREGHLERRAAQKGIFPAVPRLGVGHWDRPLMGTAGDRFALNLHSTRGARR
jgi:hypothetical protein